MAEDDTATHAEDELVHNGYENDEDVGHYVDMTSRHNACYVTAEQIGEDGHDENIYEDVDCIRSALVNGCQSSRPPRPRPPAMDWKTSRNGLPLPAAPAAAATIEHRSSTSDRSDSTTQLQDIDECLTCTCGCEMQQQSSALLSSPRQQVKSPRRGIDDADTTTTPVRSLSDIARADHVAWKRPARIWHHAIVLDVDPVSGRLEVVHYNGSVRRNEGQANFASVRREWVPVSLRSKDLYRVEYDQRLVECYAADVVVVRALSRLGEAEYHPLTRNCEHFARWCKTGQPRSVQIEHLPSRLRTATDKFADRLIMDGPVSVAKSVVNKVPQIPLQSAASAAERLAHAGFRGVFGRIAPTVQRAANELETKVSSRVVTMTAVYRDVTGTGSKARQTGRDGVTERNGDYY